MIDRRNFLTSAAGAGAAALFSGSLFERIAAAPRDLPPRPAAADALDDPYWAELRKQFLIPADEVYLNNGTVGSSPARVLKAVFDGYNTTEKMADADPEDYPIWGYGPWNEFREPLAAFVGATRDEIAFVRNATEANNYIANGLDMKPGDEVLTTDQEHGSGYSPWELKAKRYGIVMKKITLPRPVPNPALGAESFQRRHHAAHPRDFLQPHHHGYRRDAAGQGDLRAGAKQGTHLRSGWRAGDRHVAPEPFRYGLRFLHLEPAQMAHGAERHGLSLRSQWEWQNACGARSSPAAGTIPKCKPPRSVSSTSARRICLRCGACAPPFKWTMTSAWSASKRAIAKWPITFTRR